MEDDGAGGAEERRRRRRVRARKAVTVFGLERRPEIRAAAAKGPFDERSERPAPDDRSPEEGRQDPASRKKESGRPGDRDPFAARATSQPRAPPFDRDARTRSGDYPPASAGSTRPNPVFQRLLSP